MDFIPFDQLHKLAVIEGGLAPGMFDAVEVVKQEDHHQANEQPQGDILIKGLKRLFMWVF